jgi:hypothetical protein
MPRFTSTTVRRGVALAAAAGAAAALALVPAGGADAAVQAQYGSTANAGADYTGTVPGATCDLTSAAGSDAAESPIKHLTKSGTKRSSVAINATFTNSASSADQVHVKGSYSSKLVLKKKNRDLSSMTLTGSGKMAVTNSLRFGSDCSGSGTAAGLTTIAFSEHHKGHLVVTRDTTKSAVSIIILVNLKTGKLVVLDFFQGDQSHAVSKAAIKPGTYAIEEAASGVSAGSAGILLKSGTAPSKAAISTSLKLEFVPLKHK